MDSQGAKNTDGEIAGSLFERFLAFVIDCAILWFARLVISTLFAPFLFVAGWYALTRGLLPEFDFIQFVPLLILEVGLVATICAAVWLYFAFSESSRFQTTVGKYVFDLKVTDASGRPMSFPRASLRFIGKIVSGATLGIGFLAGRGNPRRRTLHDVIASTRVAKKAAGEPANKETPAATGVDPLFRFGLTAAITFLVLAVVSSLVVTIVGVWLAVTHQLPRELWLGDLTRTRPENSEMIWSSRINGIKAPPAYDTDALIK